MKRTSTVIASLAFLVASACGGSGSDDNSPTGPGGGTAITGDGNVSATVNGVSWRSAKSGDRVTRTGQFCGVTAVNPPYALILGIGGVTGPGTFSLNLATRNGSSAIISNSTGGWGTAFSGGTGTITVTALTANRIAGTFSFDAVPGSGAATGTMQVRNGTFDVTF